MQRLEELERRVGQMVIRGKIAEVDPVKHVARVAYGPQSKQRTGWLPWKPIRTGKAITWWCPEVGEGATVISEGDLALGEILPGSYHGDFPAPSNNPDEYLVLFGDGSKVCHDRKTHQLDVVNVGDVVLTTQQNLTINTDQDMTVNSTGKVAINSKAKDISLNGGAGVVTGAHICHFTGSTHGDFSAQVKAGK